MKMRPLSSILLLATLSLPASAQVLSPSSIPGAQPAGSPAAGSSANDTVIKRNQGSSASPHGEEVPLIDPTQKTVTFQGRTYSLMDNNLGGQFEAYLASSQYATKGATEYRETIEQILSLLSPSNPGGPNLKSAYALLEKASDYPGDGNICDSLANSIYSALLAKKGIGNKKEAIAKLEKERDRIIYNMGIMESKLEFQPSASGKGKSGSKQQNSRTQSTEYVMMQKRLTEIAVIKKKYETSGIIDLTQSKVQYQAMMIQLFMQRRFEHVVISSRFYNLIYKDGDQKMRMKKGADTEKFFSEGMGVNPTVAGLDAAANEGIRKVRSLVDAFNNNLKQNRLHAASERLVEAYAIGEFMPDVQTVPLELKERVQQYVQDGNDLVEALSSRELIRATELNDSLKLQARDYNSAKATSYITAHKRASDSFVRDAKLAMFDKDTASAKVAIAEALKMWPNNPSIDKFNKDLDRLLEHKVGQADMAQNTLDEFDRLIAEKNYRTIVEEPRKSRFVVVFGQANDTERADKLEQIATSIFEIEKALEKARGLKAAGQPHAAWEAIYEAQIKYYDDPKIANTKSQLSGEVATFTNALTKAKRYELGKENGTPDSGSALSWYLQARSIYPQSTFAKEGIKRLIDKEFGSE